MRQFTAASLILFLCCFISAHASAETENSDDPYVVVLGIAQDAGYPQAACRRECCAAAWQDNSLRRHVSCLGIVDPISGDRWLIDATPSFREQIRMLDEIAPPRDAANVAHAGVTGIFLTHAHIGHYTGLQHLGREVTGAKGVPVYAMPRMQQFLETNGPWSQLVDLGNISISSLRDGEPVVLNERIQVTPFLVPHRDEFSETVGYRIDGPSQSVLYIPDIDKWALWDRNIVDELATVDVAYLDGTFMTAGRPLQRDMSQIPHPFVEESMDLFAALPDSERSKVHFIHFNHTNPLVRGAGEAVTIVEGAGMRVARQGDVVPLRVQAIRSPREMAASIHVETTSTSKPVAIGAGLFSGSTESNANATLVVKIRVHRGWHIYESVAPGAPYNATTLRPILPDGVSLRGDWTKPKSHASMHSLGCREWDGTVIFSHALNIDSAAMHETVLPVEIFYQVCNPRSCQLPMTVTCNASFESR